LVAGPDHVAGAAKLVRQRRARPTRTDPRQVGTQLAALAANHVAAQAIGAKDLLAVCGVPGRYRRRHRAGERSHVREDLPDLAVLDTLRIGRRQFSAGHAAPDDVEEPVFGGTGCPETSKVGAEVPSR